MELKKQINCCNCSKPFRIDWAMLCAGHAGEYEEDRRTLVCPHCRICACHRVDAWRESGEIVYEGYSPISFGRFDWVHEDVISR